MSSIITVSQLLDSFWQPTGRVKAMRYPIPSCAELAAALDFAKCEPENDKKQLAAHCRVLLAELAGQHPGGDLEIRIPPFAAVQAGSGERGAHTRGTPPNVVEMDASTLFALATGKIAWADALAAHRVHASGVHTDLTAWFPLQVAPSISTG